MKKRNGFENAKKRNGIKSEEVTKKGSQRKARRTVVPVKKKKKNKAVFAVCAVVALVVIACLYFLLSSPSRDKNNPFNSRPEFMKNFTAQSTNSFWFGYSLDNFFALSTRPEDIEGIVRNEHSYNILVIGKDRVGLNTDVMMVLNFNSATQKINLLQIPRDTCVEDSVNRYGNKRINAVLAHWLTQNRKNYSTETEATRAGLEYFEKTIESIFGITIDKYCMIDLNGFVSIIDAIGGVPMNVPSNMYYNDPEQNLYINIKKGQQTLSGKDAEGFVRFRSGYAMGDLGRVDAQKLFLSALVEKLTSSDWYSLSRLSEVASLVIEHCTTNLTLTDIIGYLKLIDFGTLSSDSITFYTAPGEPFTGAGGASLYSLYTDETLEIINSAFNVYNIDIKPNNITLVQYIKSGWMNPNTTGLTIEEVKENQPHVWGGGSSTVVTKPEDEPNEDTPTEDIPSEDTPTEDTPTENTPTEDTPTEDTPTEDTPTEDTPTEDAPTEDTPTEDTPAEDAPAEDAPVEDEYIENTEPETVSGTEGENNG